MNDAHPYITIKAHPGGPQSPLVVSSPHSGSLLPPDFHYICPPEMLRQIEDSYVNELIAGAYDAGATLVMAEFARSYLDVNRAEDDLDPAVIDGEWPYPLHPSPRTLLGLGLVRRLCRDGVPVYGGRLPVEAVRARIMNVYRPFHAAIEHHMNAALDRFGFALLVDAHSMPSREEGGLRRLRPDMVLGDRDGTSTDPAYTRMLRVQLQDAGFAVSLNFPFKGVEILHRHGHPRRGRHALQLEINRGLYMNEETLEKSAGFTALAGDLTDVFQALVKNVMTPPTQSHAAE